jgi:hypothetical protein
VSANGEVAKCAIFFLFFSICRENPAATKRLVADNPLKTGPDQSGEKSAGETYSMAHYLRLAGGSAGLRRLSRIRD